MKKAICLLYCLLPIVGLVAQTSTNTSLSHFNTILPGYWKGTGLGGDAEEIWLPSANGEFSGIFRLTENEDVRFYEIFTLNKDGLTLKHFHADLTSWEEREETVFFKLIEIRRKALIFEGLRYQIISENILEVTVDLESEGKIHTEKFTFKKIE